MIGVHASGNNSVVECDLAKVEVAGSNPVSRSNFEWAGPPHPAWRAPLRGSRSPAPLRAYWRVGHRARWTRTGGLHSAGATPPAPFRPLILGRAGPAVRANAFLLARCSRR